MLHWKLVSQQDFDQVFEIMQEAFPPVERRNYLGQKALLEEKQYQLYAVLNQCHEIRGFLGTWIFHDFVFVEHFAVNQKKRNTGIGTQILKEFCRHFEKTVVLEVEPPETEMAKKRIKFYQRQGFFLNQFAYEQPPLQPEAPWIPLQIMTYPKAFPKKQLENFKKVLYKSVYKR